MSNLRVLWVTLAVFGIPSLVSAQQPAPPVYWTRGFEFEDVDVSAVAARLRSFGIPVPVLLEGNATVDLSVSIPLDQLTNGRAYRVQGSFRSPRLRVDTFLLGALSGRLTIENGVLTLAQLQGQFLDPDAPTDPTVPADVLGNFAGSASAELLPIGALTVDLRVQDLDVRFIDPFMVEPIPELAGAVDGRVEASAPLEEIALGSAYAATASLTSDRLSYGQLSLSAVTANLQLNEGTVQLTSLAGRLLATGADTPRGMVRGTATVQLIPLGEISIHAAIDQLDLSLLAMLAETPELQITGAADVELNATALVENADQIASWSGDGQLAIDRLTVQQRVVTQRVVESARIEFEFAAATFTADSVTIDIDGVPLRGRASVRLADTADQQRGWSAALQTDSAEVADLLRLLVGSAPPETTGTVSFAIDAAGSLDPPDTDAPGTDVLNADVLDADPPEWSVAGTVDGVEIHVAGFRIGPLSHQLQVTAESFSLEPGPDAEAADLLLRSLRARYATSAEAITLEDLALEGWNGRLSGTATWSRLDAGQHRAVVDWSDLQFAFRAGAIGAPAKRLATTLATTTSGHVEWSAPADALRRPAAHRFNLRAEVADVHTEQLAVGAFEVALDARQLPWQLRGRGRLFDVPTEISATLQVPAAARWEDLPLVPGRASLVAGPVALAPLLDRLSDTPADPSTPADPGAPANPGAPSLQGTALLRVAAVTSSSAPPQMTAELRIADLVYGDAGGADAFSAAAQLALVDGKIRLSDLRGQLSGTRLSDTDRTTPPLRFSGLAVAEVAPLGDLAFEIAAEAVDLAWFRPWMPTGEGPSDDRSGGTIAGTVGGTVRAAVPLDQMDRLAAWKGVGRIRSPAVEWGDLRIVSASADLVLHEGTLIAERMYGVANGVALAGRAAVELETDADSEGAWQARLQTGGAQLQDVFALLGGTAPAETDGFLSFDVYASGQTSDSEAESWRASGDVSGESLRIAGFEVGALRHRLRLTPEEVRLEPRPSAELSQLRLRRLGANYVVDDLGWRLDEFRLEGWGGMVSGNATWSQTEENPHRAHVAWSDLRIPFPVDFMDEDATIVQTLTAGTLDWSAPPAALSNPSAHRFALAAQARDIHVGELDVGELHVQIDATDPSWEVRGDGTLLSGPARLVATLDVAEADSWGQLTESPAEGELVLGPMRIGSLFQVWHPTEAVDSWSGTASLRWTAETDGQSALRSLGQLSIENLEYGNQSITDRLQIVLEGVGSELEIRSFRGTYAGGRIQGSGHWSAESGPRRLAIRLSAVDASRALLPVVASSGDWFDGRLSADLVIAGQSPLQRGPLRLTGRMELRDGETFGIQSRSLRANLRGSLALPNRRWSLELGDLRATRGRGRVVGQIRVEQSLARRGRVDMVSRFEAIALDFQDLLADVSDGGPPSFGSGSLTGTVTLSGRAIESFADLEGRIVGELGGTDAAAVPGLLSAQNYLGVLSLRNTQFDRGEIEARLRLGELQINELWLSSDQLRVWATGDVSLRSGRLDIEAIAATGDFQEGNTAILGLARAFALEAALPIGLITQVNELLSDRVVALSIRGTYQRPAIRIRPAATLTENAARFFLREAAGIIIPTAGSSAFTSDR